MRTLLGVILLLMFMAAQAHAGVTIKAVTEGGQEVVITELSDTDVKALKFYYGDTATIVKQVEAGIDRLVRKSKGQFEKTWREKIKEDSTVTSAPTKTDDFIEYITTRDDYDAAAAAELESRQPRRGRPGQ